MKYPEPNSPKGRALARILAGMLDELEANALEIVLIPATDPGHSGHKVRAVQGQNAAWYSAFCAEYVSIRGKGRKRYKRPRTFIVRSKVVETLRQMIAGDYRGIYAERIFNFVERKRSNRKFRKTFRQDRQTDWPSLGIWF